MSSNKVRKVVKRQLSEYIELEAFGPMDLSAKAVSGWQTALPEVSF
jgi:hypothetical protein